MGCGTLVVSLGAGCLCPTGGTRGSEETSLNGQCSHCVDTFLTLSNSVCLCLCGTGMCFSLTPHILRPFWWCLVHESLLVVLIKKEQCQGFLCRILVMLLPRSDPQASPYVAYSMEHQGLCAFCGQLAARWEEEAEFYTTLRGI